MDQILLDKLAKLNISRKRRRTWKRFVRFVALAVVFCTTYALILPAITMHTELICDLKEHTHSLDCGPVYACSQELQDKTVIHSHDGLCFDASGQLLCNLAELEAHMHTDACSQTRNLICGKEEADPHSHGESCYILYQEPQCGMDAQEPHEHQEACFGSQLNCLQDQEPVHQHVDACYTPEQVLSCGLSQQEGHSHTDACYDVQSRYICGLEESEGHTHGDDCMEESRILSCGSEEITAHEHNEQCYTEALRLTCEISTQPHVHGEQCYETQTICGLPETEGHSHTEECYLQKVCLLEEQEGHTHTEDCWETVSCQLTEVSAHSHDDTCLDENRELICQLKEVLIHQHEESCIVWQCGLESHIHEESCYPKQETASAEPELLCGFGAHSHMETCYDENDLLICSIPEHRHTAPCVLETYDAQADTEDQTQWMASFAGNQLTEDWRCNTADIAASQLGYMESRNNVVLLEDGSLKGYTRYGAWYGSSHCDWNVPFAQFCLHYAGVESFPVDKDPGSWMQLLQNHNLFRQNGQYSPDTGDVMFLDRDLDGCADWVALVLKSDGDGWIYTVQGDVEDSVAAVDYQSENPCILGFGMIPPASTRSLCADGEDYKVEVQLSAKAMIPADAELVVEEILPDTEAYQIYYDQSLQAIRPEEEETNAQIRFARFFDIRFLANGITMEPEAPVNVCISYTDGVEISKEDQGLAIHFASDGVEVLNAETERSQEQEQTTTGSFAFTQGSFSVTGTVIASGRAGIDLSNASKLTDSLSQIHVTNDLGMETKIFAHGDTFRIVMEGSLYSWQFTNGQSKTLYFNLSDTMRLERYTCSDGISSAMIDGASNTFLMEVPAVSNGNNFQFRVELEGKAVNQTGGISYVTIRWDQYQVYSGKQNFVVSDDRGNTVTADLMGSSYSPSQYELVLEQVDGNANRNTIETWVRNNYHRRELEGVVQYRVYLVNQNNPSQQIPLPAPYTLVIDYVDSPFELKPQGTAVVINMNNGSANTPGSSSASLGDGVSRVCIADQHSPLSQFAVAYLNGIAAGTTGSGYTLEYNEVRDAFLRDPAYSSYYRSNSPIGTAGSFHIVAFDTANLNTHTNGNILARNLNAYSNFGTNNFPEELSYIQNYRTVNSNSASDERHVLVLGSGNTIGFYDNNNKYSVNGQGIDRPKTIIQDVDTALAPFIDLNRVRGEIQQISARLVGYQNQSISVTQYSQKNVLQLTDPDGVGVLNVHATDPVIFGRDYIQLDGFRSGHDGSIVINVDCSGISQINMPKALVVVDGQEQPTSEVTEFSNGKVLWNFVNAQGVTINTHLMTGMVIAPGATVNIMQNLNGTVVADVVNVNAESHRTDFTGKIVPKTNTDSYSATIQKVRTGYMGTTLAGAVFDLYIWNGSGWQKVNPEPLVTNGSGLFLIDRLHLDTAYQLVETKAPEGYISMEKPYEFWVRSNGNLTQPARRPQNFAGVAISSGSVLNIPNDLDEKVKTTSLEIQKVWDTPEAPSVNMISVTLYQMKWKDQELLEKKEFRTVILSSVLGWKTTLQDLPLITTQEDGTTITYTYGVKEEPLEGYSASYSIDNNAGVTEGVITITNRVDSPDTVYTLPETGGDGSVQFVLTGLILTFLAVIQLVYLHAGEIRKFHRPDG